jgi:hypothetical protein
MDRTTGRVYIERHDNPSLHYITFPGIPAYFKKFKIELINAGWPMRCPFTLTDTS